MLNDPLTARSAERAGKTIGRMGVMRRMGIKQIIRLFKGPLIPRNSQPVRCVCRVRYISRIGCARIPRQCGMTLFKGSPIPRSAERAGKDNRKNGSNEKNGYKIEKANDTPVQRLSNSSESDRYNLWKLLENIC